MWYTLISFVFYLFFLSWLPVAQYTLAFYKKTPSTYIAPNTWVSSSLLKWLLKCTNMKRNVTSTYIYPADIFVNYHAFHKKGMLYHIITQ